MSAAVHEAERAVLGAILLEPDRLPDLRAILATPEAFACDRHRRIFQAVLDCEEDGRPLDTVSVAEMLERQNSLDAAGGVQYLAELYDDAVAPQNAELHARSVREDFDRRQVAAILTKARDALKEGDTESVLAALTRDLQAVEIGARPGAVSFSDAIEAALDQAESIAAAGSGLRFGIDPLDAALGGLEPGRLVTVAAGTGGAKSAVLLNAARTNAEDGHPVAVFSLEMPRREVASRMLAQSYQVGLGDLLRGRKEALRRVYQGIQANPVTTLPIWINDVPQDVDALCAAAASLVRKSGVRLVVVDYLQLIEVTGMKNRYESISQISRRLKRLAMKLDVTVLAAAQVNRNAASENRELRLSDLRDSGSIEQDSDVVVFAETISKDFATGDRSIRFTVAKNRSGRAAALREPVKFIGRYQQFTTHSSQPDATAVA